MANGRLWMKDERMILLLVMSVWVLAGCYCWNDSSRCLASLYDLPPPVTLAVVDSDHDSSSTSSPPPSGDNHENNSRSKEKTPEETNIAPSIHLEPIQVLQEYISQHSVDILLAEPDNDRRRSYLTAEYACPHRAGNVMSNYLNSMLLAVLTNRTMLMQYSKDETAQKQCDRILKRASWIPPYRSSSSPRPFKLDQRQDLLDACERVLHVTGRDQYECQKRVLRDLYTQNKTAAILAPAGGLASHGIVNLRGVTGCLHAKVGGWEGRFDMTVPACGDYVRALFAGEVLEDRVEKLFGQGLDFLYGMLFRYSFTLTEEFMQTVKTTGGVFDPAAFSVGVHSRHAQEWDDGSDISKQTACLDRVFEADTFNDPTTIRPCQILIMSDRQATNQALVAYAQQRQCDGITVTHQQQHAVSETFVLVNTSSKSVRAEHGPFEGAGFYKDMALVSKARHGFVATTRSSSALVQHVMVYDQVLHNAEEKIEICYHQFQGPSQQQPGEIKD
jgi:hypothetical protein